MHGSLPYAAAVTTALAEACEDARVRFWTEGEGPQHDDLARRVLDRVLAWPIADRATLAAAVGAAWGGLKVVVEVGAPQRLAALTEALAAACQPREGFPCTVVLRVPWGGEAGAADGGVLDALAAIPGLVVTVPRDAATAAAQFRAALSRTSPTVVLEPRALLRTGSAAGGDATEGAVVMRAGRGLTVAALGAAVGQAVAVADALAEEGLDIEVIDLAIAAPIPSLLGERVVASGRLLVVAPPGDEAWAARCVARAVEHAFWYLEAPCAVTGIEGLAPAIRATLAA